MSNVTFMESFDGSTVCFHKKGATIGVEQLLGKELRNVKVGGNCAMILVMCI